MLVIFLLSEVFKNRISLFPINTLNFPLLWMSFQDSFFLPFCAYVCVSVRVGLLGWSVLLDMGTGNWTRIFWKSRGSSYTPLYLQPMVWNLTANVGNGSLVLVVLLPSMVPGVVCMIPSPTIPAASCSHCRVPLLILPSARFLSALRSPPN